jgi:hypothetical protein
MTTAFVSFMKTNVDRVNRWIAWGAAPLYRATNKVSEDVPWLPYIFCTTAIAVVPLYFFKIYGYSRDTRIYNEKERVRLSVQKAIDPFPSNVSKDVIALAYKSPKLSVSLHTEESIKDMGILTEGEKRRQELYDKFKADPSEVTFAQLLALEEKLQRDAWRPDRSPAKDLAP